MLECCRAGTTRSAPAKIDQLIFGQARTKPEEFNGLRKLVSAAQSINTNDTTNYYLDLIDLARLVGMIKSNSGRPHCLWTSPLGARNIVKAYLDKGIQPEYVPVDVPDSNGGMKRRLMLAYEGIPVYVDEFYPKTPEGAGTGDTVGTFQDGTSIYAMVLGRGGVYGIVPAGFGQKMIRVKEVLTASVAQTTYRVYWPVGLVLERHDGLARLRLRAMTGTVVP